MKISNLNTGFTLIELLVVLLILTILTTVAVQSVDGIQDQSRYEATQRGMQNIEDAVLGPSNQREADGSELVTGFVADMGRPPVAFLMPDGSMQMRELGDNPNGLQPFGIRQANAAAVGAANEDLEVFVPCGWRGPYLRLGVGQTDLFDGWGRPFDLFNADRSTVVAGGIVSLFRSRGADHPDINTAPSNDYREELYVHFQSDAFVSPAYPVTAAVDRYHASTVQVTVIGPVPSDAIDPLNGSVVVKYFGPDPATGGIKLLSSTPVVPTGSPIVVTFNDPAITIGPRIFRAYQINGATVTKQSPVIRVVLKPGGKQITLRLN